MGLPRGVLLLTLLRRRSPELMDESWGEPLEEAFRLGPLAHPGSSHQDDARGLSESHLLHTRRVEAGEVDFDSGPRYRLVGSTTQDRYCVHAKYPLSAGGRFQQRRRDAEGPGWTGQEGWGGSRICPSRERLRAKGGGNGKTIWAEGKGRDVVVRSRSGIGKVRLFISSELIDRYRST